ncbi:MAG: LysM peptidoglycan-binding domain-containing protein [Candidatus Saccharibacteria bacterium]
MGNLLILVTLLAFVLQNPHTTASSNAVLSSPTQERAAINPLDQLSSADIALTVARLNNLPEATAINNQADSQASELTMAPTTDNVVSKPQVVTTALKSRNDIRAYKTVTGDTISSLAAKFGVTSDSIRWSNAVVGDTITVGVNLMIPPVTGIVYTVKAGDTVDSLASKYKVTQDQIVAYNDTEISGIKVGEQILIPNGSLPAPVLVRVSTANSYSGFAWGGGAPVYGSNGYDFGYCTWYVANRIAVPSNWGNANTWDNYAPQSGWIVSSTPRAGAVGQSDAGYEGHVAIVEAVSDDGTQIKYSDMNGLAGFGRIGYSGWVSASKFPHYIYR